MKTEIWTSFNYGGWHIVFSKTFDLPFTPFPGLVIGDYRSDVENEIHLDNHDYCNTTIIYDINEQTFHINVRNVWKFPVDSEHIDEIIDNFTKTDWQREDTTNIDDLKELMKRDYEKR